MSPADLLTRELRDDDVIEVRNADGKLRGRFCLDQPGYFARAWDAVSHFAPAGMFTAELTWSNCDWDKWNARYGTWQSRPASNGKLGEVVAFGSWLRIPKAAS